MNEGALLERFRAELAEPGEATTQAARLRFRHAPDPEASPQRSYRRRARWIVPASVAAAVVLALVVPTLVPLGRPGGPDPAAADLLRRFSTLAAHLPAEPAPKPGQFVYSRTSTSGSYVFVSGDGQTRFVYSVRGTETMWLGPDGSGRQLATTGQPAFPTATDRAAYEAYIASDPSSVKEWFDWGSTSDQRYSAGELMWRDTSQLPTDPESLGKLIDDRVIVGGPDGDWESFVLAADLLRDSYARPELRAALFTYMSTLPGIEIVGPTKDAAGRPGIALASTHGGYRMSSSSTDGTGKVLEERDIVLDPEQGIYDNPGPVAAAYARAGGTLYRTTYLVSGAVVDSTTDVPSSAG